MALFRKKPVVVEARRFVEEEVWEIEEWCGGSIKGVKLPTKDWELSIETLEGEMRAKIGDWIIKGVKGEFYPCKPDIFRETYESVA